MDVLVVADDSVANTRKESLRLRDAVGSIDMPMDILVVRESRFEELKDKVGLIYREALRTGRLVYEAQGEDGSRCPGRLAAAHGMHSKDAIANKGDPAGSSGACKAERADKVRTA